MPDLIPVDHDPFTVELTPVNYDPFASQPQTETQPVQQPVQPAAASEPGPLRVTVTPGDSQPISQEDLGDPFEAAAARVRARYQTRPTEPPPQEPLSSSLPAWMTQFGPALAEELKGLHPSNWGTVLAEMYRRKYDPETYAQMGKYVAGLPERIAGASEEARTEGTYDPEPVMSALQLAAGARQPFIKPGEAGMFGGRLAANADLEMLRAAERLHEQGAGMNSIRKATGWFLDPADKIWKFEFSDRGSKFKTDYADRLRPQSENVENTQPLAERFIHPELEKAYPGLLAGIKYGRTPTSWPKSVVGGYDPESRTVVMQPDLSAKEARSTLLHELSHVIQEREGFGRGANTIEDFVTEAGKRETPQFQKLAEQWLIKTRDELTSYVNQRISEGATPDQAFAEIRASRPDIEKEISEAKRLVQDPAYAEHQATFGAYKRVAGETEARNVQTRANFTDKQRREMAPWETAEFPSSSLLVRKNPQGILPFSEERPGFQLRQERPEEGGFQPLTVPKIKGGGVLPVQSQEQADKLVAAGKASWGRLGKLDRDPNERALTVNDILHPDTPSIKAYSRTTGEIARQLMQRGSGALKALGIRAGKLTEPGLVSDEYLSRAIASEIKAALKRGGAAADWYTNKIKEAMGIAEQLHPELRDPNQKFAFTAALAITSQGETVTSNVRLAEQAYAQFKKTGRFPTDIKASKQKYMNGNFQKLNDLIEQHGIDGARDWLHSKTTVRELKGQGYRVGGENMDTEVHGSAIFGPKIGQGFFQNLNGNFNPVTMDLWFMRAWGRLTGTLVGKVDMAKQTARLQNALIEAGQAVPETKTGLVKKANEIIAAHEKDFRVNRKLYDSGEKKKSELTYAAERYEAGLYGINETPKSGAHRQWMRDRVNRAREILANEGVNISNADLQAIWWYPEKELYAKLGGRSSEAINIDYAKALSELLNRRGGGQ